MAGRLYRMAKVVSANPSSWGIVDAKEISGFRRVSKLTDLYSIAECILSSAYGDGTTNGEDAVGQIWYVAETKADYKLTNWANRKSASGWTRLSYGGDVSVPVKDVRVDGTTVLSNGIANITGISELNSKTSSLEQDLTDTKKVLSLVTKSIGVKKGEPVGDNRVSLGIATLDTNGNVPLSQLGNLDMTVFKVVNALPTTNIENKVYLVRANNVGDKNNYAEYIYTGNRTAAYDATKWEKLGEVAAKVDLSGYMTANDVRDAIQSTQSSIENDYNGKFNTVQTDINSINNSLKTKAEIATIKAKDITYDHTKGTLSKGDGDGNTKTTLVSLATNTTHGFMSKSDKAKLDALIQTSTQSGDNTVTDRVYSVSVVSTELNKKVNKTVADNTYATKTAFDTLSTTVSNIKQFNPTIPSNLPIASSIVLYDPNTNNANYLDGVQVMSDGRNSVIVADQFDGKATKAIADENGRNINATYAKKADLNNHWTTTNLEAISNTDLDKILNT